MNIFTAIGQVLNSFVGVATETGKAMEAVARTAHKTVTIAETAVDQMIAEQEAEIAALKADMDTKKSTKS